MKAILEGIECQLSTQAKDALLSLIQATFTTLNSVLNSTIERCIHTGHFKMQIGIYVRFTTEMLQAKNKKRQNRF